MVTDKLPCISVFVLILRPPLLKEAVNEPDANFCAVSEIGKLINCEPSPLNSPLKEPLKSALPVKEPVNCPLTLSKSKLLTNPLFPWSSETTIAGEPESEALKFGTPKFGST